MQASTLWHQGTVPLHLHVPAAAFPVLTQNLAATSRHGYAGHAATHEQGGKDGSAAEAGAGPCLVSGAPPIVLLYYSTSNAACAVDMFLLRERCQKQPRLLSRSLLRDHCCVWTRETAAVRRHAHFPNPQLTRMMRSGSWYAG